MDLRDSLGHTLAYAIRCGPNRVKLDPMALKQKPRHKRRIAAGVIIIGAIYVFGFRGPCTGRGTVVGRSAAAI